MTDTTSFSLFTVMWNQLQGQATPIHHVRIARWLENGQADLRLLMAFRGSGKSTMVGLYCAWRLSLNPDCRVLVLAADEALAKKMVRQVKRLLERHPLTKNLRPRFADQWASDRFTVARTLELRDPSMLAKGIDANLTGCRADLIICDDVEVPNTCATLEKRKELRERLFELSYILTPGGQILYVGTPHHADSLYKTECDPITGAVPFLNDAIRFVLPVVDHNGDSAWPERFSVSEIERIQRQAGPLTFASQMLLQPVSMDKAFLNAEALYQRDIPMPHITQLVASWDPAFGSRQGDGSVLAIINAIKDGTFHVADIKWITADQDDEDEATQQCRKVIECLRHHNVKRLLLETNGIGKFLPAILRRELKAQRYSCAVIETVQRTNKSERILAAFDPLLAAKALSIAKDVASSPFVEEMRAYSPSSKHNRDDALDAVATALLALSVSLPKRVT